MKRSKYQYDKKGRASRKSTSKSLNHNKSVTRIMLSYVAIVVVGLASFVFLFPELIVGLFPELSSSNFLRFFYSISAFFTNLWMTIRTSSFMILLGSLFLTIILLVVLYRFSPYVMAKNQEVFCQRKLFFPYYKFSTVLLVTSANKERNTNRFQLTKADNNFGQTLVLNINHIEMLILKHESIISIYFILARRGFFKKNILKTIQKDLLFLSNLLSTSYETSNETLTIEQTNTLFQAIKKMKIKHLLDFSSLDEIETDMMELMYKTIENASHPNLILLMRVEKKDKDSSKLILHVSSFSDDKQALNYLQHASGLKRKRRFLNSKRQQSVHLDDLPKYIHLPSTYEGSNFNLYSKEKIPKRYEQSIVLGYHQKGIASDEILISVEDLLYNVEIYGMIGRGKTRLVCSMIDQLLS